jgi:hypothetical protein
VTDCNERKHPEHSHRLGSGCGHTAIRHGDHVDEHTVEISATNALTCTPDHACEGHDAAHRHGPGCGHEAVPHGDHIDYLVGDHLHHPHEGHCDNHGPIGRV